MTATVPTPPPWPDMSQQFRELYARLGPSQLADQTGVDRTTLWRLEQGHTVRPCTETRTLIYGRIASADESKEGP